MATILCRFPFFTVHCEPRTGSDPHAGLCVARNQLLRPVTSHDPHTNTVIAGQPSLVSTPEQVILSSHRAEAQQARSVPSQARNSLAICGLSWSIDNNHANAQMQVSSCEAT